MSLPGDRPGTAEVLTAPLERLAAEVDRRGRADLSLVAMNSTMSRDRHRAAAGTHLDQEWWKS
ncbi:hypothetical protein [Streptomyces erythrochromogenes]|uniref:hypothetical protein n=1 Tax=Streptomyces erythrochromogenes TaxID=285574 RepID=UPI00381DC819